MDEPPFEIVPGLYQSGTPRQVDADVVMNLQMRPPSYLPEQPQAEQFISMWWPIHDGPMPDARMVRSLATFISRLLDEERRVLIHCAAGNNRSGLVVARTLIERGRSPQEAIGAVRSAIPSALSNPEFESWLLNERPPERS
ncbi:MAG: dual specificity protein phosphatase family protein [Actinomycetota bacterium]|nr:dual specificity protein phosphatase family protein [Actinomycetota bacterium]